ncbi:MAG: hypothetical protein AAGA64_17300, partial [Bacteroidota bacterium]
QEFYLRKTQNSVNQATFNGLQDSAPGKFLLKQVVESLSYMKKSGVSYVNLIELFHWQIRM